MSDPIASCRRHLTIYLSLLIGGSLTLLTIFLVWRSQINQNSAKLTQPANSLTLTLKPVLLGLGFFLMGGISGYKWRSQRHKHALETLIQNRTQELEKAYLDCEKRFEQQNLALEAANKAKNQLLSHISHELRTPLNSISGFVELLARDSTLTSEKRSNLAIIARNTDYLLNLSTEILDVAKLESENLILHPTGFNLRRLIDEVIEMLQGKAQAKGIQLLSYLDIDIPQYIKTDEEKLRQILVNLLDNRIKFTPKGSVNLRIAGSDQTWAFTDDLLGLDQDNSYLLVFEVEDTGIGMTAAELTQIFEPFVQTDTPEKQLQGTGLGLFIAQKLVKLMGNEIKVKSTKDRGTLFQFKIRVSLPENSEIFVTQPQSCIIGLAEHQTVFRLLIVDDKTENRQLLVRLLTPLGFRVREASNGQEALEIWSDWQPHLIFMDTKMPIMDGYNTIQKLKETNSPIKPIIIAVTAGMIDENRANLLVSSCDGILKKPFHVDLVLEILANYLGVKYRYKNTDFGVLFKDQEFLNQVTIEAQDLEKMPIEWLEKVNYAAKIGHQRKILALLDEINPDQEKLLIALRQLATDFNFRKIRELTQISIEQNQENSP